jgi:uncharacterized protein (TIGR02596 family)
MKRPRFPAFPSAARRGFTLLELLAVLGVIGICAVIAVPAFAPMMKTGHLNQAGILVADEFNYARQAALSKNALVEVRLYRLPSTQNSAVKVYRALRSILLENGDPSKARPLTVLKYLPGPIIISADAGLSPLLDSGNASRSGLASAQETLTALSGPVDYVSFAFKPDGSTGLSPVTPPLGNWFLTLYSEQDAGGASGSVPANSFTVQLDPVTGRTRTHRP